MRREGVQVRPHRPGVPTPDRAGQRRRATLDGAAQRLLQQRRDSARRLVDAEGRQ